jgi:Cdc6-like AAA superfamily ATPase
MKSKFVFAFAVMMFTPVALQAQEGSADARINAAIETAISAGIPAELLQSKVNEGRAKGVSEARIAAAVEARLQVLTRAAEAFERAEVENTTAADLSVAADAIEAGVTENTLIKVTRTAPAERRAVAIATLTGLVQLGHASDHALARVSSVVRSKAELARLNADVAAQLQTRGILNGTVGGTGSVRIN